MPDAIEMLKQDHREVEALFAQFESTGDVGTALRICEELTIHALLEEEHVYPLLRAKIDRDLADEARKEHEQAKDLIREAQAATDNAEQLRKVMAQLKESVQHHVAEEETTVFPRMEQDRATVLVDQLGDDLLKRKQELQARAERDRTQGVPPSTTGEKPVVT